MNEFMRFLAEADQKKFARVTSHGLINPVDDLIMISKLNLVHGDAIELKLSISLISLDALASDFHQAEQMYNIDQQRKLAKIKQPHL